MLLDQYADHIAAAITAIRETQREKIIQAAQMVKAVLVRDGLIYVFGCGHSHILAEETFYRAGGLANVAPVFYEPLMLHQGAAESSRLEKQPGLAREVLKNCPATKNDIFFCLSTSGVNAVPVETAEIIHSRGIPTVAICSSAYFDQNARSASGKHLYEVSDLWIDNKAPHGDACLLPQGAAIKTTPLSTITGAFILNSILAEATQLALAEGVDVPIYLSGNIPGGAERNKALIDRFSPASNPCEVPVMQPKTARIGCVGLGGESVFLTADHFHAPGETLCAESIFIEPGGKAYNQAVAAARLGAQVCFFGAVAATPAALFAGMFFSGKASRPSCKPSRSQYRLRLHPDRPPG